MNYSEQPKRKTWTRNFSPVIETINNNKNVKVPCVRLKPLFMFTLMNTAICLSALIILRHAGYALLAMTLGILGPLVTLMLSKFLAKSAFDLEVINPDDFQNNDEQQLYNVVEVLSNRAGLKTVPEVALYQSPDMNAFATGPSRNNAIVAFSSALLDKMDEKAFAAVAAHEIAHIANGDMLTMTLLQSAINTVVIIIDMALATLMYNKKDGLLAIIIKAVFRWVVVYICLFIGNLLAMWYSRHREFKADALASKLVNADSMIQALNFLKEDQNIEIPEHIAHAQEAYASFKISSKTAFLEWFSTHPSLDKRIVKLNTSSAAQYNKAPEDLAKSPRNKSIASDNVPSSKTCKKKNIEAKTSVNIETKAEYKTYEEVIYYRKYWCFGILFFLLNPIALAILASGEIYYQRDEQLKTLSTKNRVILATISIIFITLMRIYAK